MGSNLVERLVWICIAIFLILKGQLFKEIPDVSNKQKNIAKVH
jgi:hypothetical protein